MKLLIMQLSLTWLKFKVIKIVGIEHNFETGKFES
jgi:hypothetical protein